MRYLLFLILLGVARLLDLITRKNAIRLGLVLLVIFLLFNIRVAPYLIAIFFVVLGGLIHVGRKI